MKTGVRPVHGQMGDALAEYRVHRESAGTLLHRKHHDFNEIKRRVYLSSTLVGTPILILVLLAGVRTVHPEWPGVIAHAGLVFVCIWLLWGLWTRRRSVAVCERVVFRVMVAYYLAILSSSIYRVDSVVLLRLSLAERQAWVLMVLCIVGYLVYDLRIALRYATFLTGITFLLVWGRLMSPSVVAEFVKSESIGLVQLQFGIIATLVLIHGLAYTKERLIHVELVADSLARVAHVDALTQVYNRRWISTVLVDELDRANRYGRDLSIVLFDIDDFKRINDTYGHRAGDAVLQEIARLVKSNIRESDQMARWGGEEFLVLCPGSDSEATQVLAERLREVVEGRTFNGMGNVTASFGVASYLKGQSVDELIGLADRSLYKAKDLGRNMVVAK